MSGLRACTKISKTPYYIEEIDQNVFSLEEISYFIYNYTYVVDKKFFSEELISYIENSLEAGKLAGKLRQHIKADSSAGAMAVVILRASGFYEEDEIREIEPVLESIENRNHLERQKLKADAYRKRGRYDKALLIYLKILEMNHEYNLSVGFYADVNYEIGNMFACFFEYGRARYYYMEAFKLAAKNEYLKRTVMCCLIEGAEDVLYKLVRHFNISSEILIECRKKYESLKNAAGNSAGFDLAREQVDYIAMLGI